MQKKALPIEPKEVIHYGIHPGPEALGPLNSYCFPSSTPFAQLRHAQCLTRRFRNKYDFHKSKLSELSFLTASLWQSARSPVGRSQNVGVAEEVR
jgi:hypothetical protein